MENIKEFKEYYCKFRCKYKDREIVTTNVDVWEGQALFDFIPCHYCQVDEFFNTYELEHKIKRN